MISQPVAAATEPSTRPRSTLGGAAGPFADQRFQVEAPGDRVDRFGDPRMARRATPARGAPPRRSGPGEQIGGLQHQLRSRPGRTATRPAAPPPPSPRRPQASRRPKRRSARRCSGSSDDGQRHRPEDRREQRKGDVGAQRDAEQRQRDEADRADLGAALAGRRLFARGGPGVALSRSRRASRFGASGAHRLAGCAFSPAGDGMACPLGDVAAEDPRGIRCHSNGGA